MTILRRNNVRIIGHGSQTMIFAHGFGCDQTMWRFITPAFEERYRIVLFDYVGCGGSDKTAYDSAHYSTLDGYADDVLDVCAALDLRNAIFVGHSVSGMIGAIAAMKAPRFFSRIIMLGPSACYVNDVESGYSGGFEQSDIDGLLASMDGDDSAWAGYLSKLVMGNPARPHLANELSTLFCAVPAQVAREFAEVTFRSDSRHYIGKLSLPTLLVQCNEDAVAPATAVEALHQSIPGSYIVRLEAKGHVPQMSAPDETIEAIRSFLDIAGIEPEKNAFRDFPSAVGQQDRSVAGKF